MWSPWQPWSYSCDSIYRPAINDLRDCCSSHGNYGVDDRQVYMSQQ